MDPRLERPDPDAEPGDGPSSHRLDVYLVNGEVVDVRLDDESVWPVWFKLEWKGNGEMSAKVRGVRLSTRLGDSVTIHQQASLTAKPAGETGTPPEPAGRPPSA